MRLGRAHEYLSLPTCISRFWRRKKTSEIRSKGEAVCWCNSHTEVLFVSENLLGIFPAIRLKSDKVAEFSLIFAVNACHWNRAVVEPTFLGFGANTEIEFTANGVGDVHARKHEIWCHCERLEIVSSRMLGYVEI